MDIATLKVMNQDFMNFRLIPWDELHFLARQDDVLLALLKISHVLDSNLQSLSESSGEDTDNPNSGRKKQEKF